MQRYEEILGEKKKEMFLKISFFITCNNRKKGCHHGHPMCLFFLVYKLFNNIFNVIFKDIIFWYIF